jgi:hypothetical protein
MGWNPVQDAGKAIGGFSDWLASKTQRPHYGGYNIDPTAFTDPNAQANKDAWAAAQENAQGRTYTEDPKYRQFQDSLVAQLQSQANGQAPSIAKAALQQQTNRNISQAAGLQASARGVNPALAARQVGNEAAAMNQEAAGQGAIAQLQERENAQAMLGSELGNVRQQNLTADQMAQQQQARNDELVKFYTSLGYSQDQASFAAKQALQGLEVQNALGAQGITAGAKSAWESNFKDYLGGILGAAGAAGQGAASAGAGAPAAAAVAASKGAVVPGADTGTDDKLVAARGGEVVVNPENPIYPEARAAVEDPRQTTGGAPLMKTSEAGDDPLKWAPFDMWGRMRTRELARQLVKRHGRAVSAKVRGIGPIDTTKPAESVGAGG